MTAADAARSDGRGGGPTNALPPEQIPETLGWVAHRLVDGALG